MLEDFFIEFLKLKNARETFATAMVVQHGTPISGKTGDKAIIRSDAVSYTHLTLPTTPYV